MTIKDIQEHKDFTPCPSAYENLVNDLYGVCNEYADKLFAHELISALEIVKFSYLMDATEWEEQ